MKMVMIYTIRLTITTDGNENNVHNTGGVCYHVMVVMAMITEL